MRGKSNLLLWCGAFLTTAIFFQNCSENRDGTLTTSRSSFQKNEKFANKEIIAKLSDAASDETFRNWALSNGLNLESEWTDRQMTHWKWEAEATVAQIIAKAQSQEFADKIEFVEPNYILSNPSHDQDLPQLVDPQNGPIATSSLSVSDLGRFSSSAKNEVIHEITGIVNVQGTGDLTKKILVAVLDTGLDVNHSFFNASKSLWTNPGEIPGDGIDNDGNGRIDDIHGWNFVNETSDLSDSDGHGTHCAGTVLNVGVDLFSDPIEESPIEVMGLKFIGTSGGKTSDAIKAIDYAVAMGAQVLSNSWGGPSPSQALMSSLTNASNRGVFIAAAAGNDSVDNDVNPSFPANIDVPNLVAVAASGPRDDIAFFSNYGVRTVHLSAPGVSVLSTYPQKDGADQYNFLSGTSMATPYVAGAAAMMLNANSQLNGFDVKNILLDQVDPVNGFDAVLITGGRLNAVNSRTVASKSSSTDQPQIAGGSFASFEGGGGASFGQDDGGGGGCGTVTNIASSDGDGTGSSTAFLLILPLLAVLAIRLKEDSFALGDYRLLR